MGAVRSSDCKRCGKPMNGDYCAQCGQRTARELEMQRILSEASDAVMDLDFRIVRTARDMLLRPGHLVRRYVEGDRITWSNPLRFMFLAVTLYALTIAFMAEVQPFGLTVTFPEGLGEAYLISVGILGYVAWLFMLPAAWVASKLFRVEGMNFTAHYVAFLFLYGEKALLLTPLALSGFLDLYTVRVVGIAYMVWAIVDYTGARDLRGVLKALLVYVAYLVIASIMLSFIVGSILTAQGRPPPSLFGGG